MKIKVDEQGRVIGFVEVGGMDGAMEYTGAIPDDFLIHSRQYMLKNGQLVRNTEQITDLYALQEELEEMYEWFYWYDNQVQQYSRSVRMGEEFDEDIEELDGQAKQKQLRIREIRQTLQS